MRGAVQRYGCGGVRGQQWKRLGPKWTNHCRTDSEGIETQMRKQKARIERVSRGWIAGHGQLPGRQMNPQGGGQGEEGGTGVRAGTVK